MLPIGHSIDCRRCFFSFHGEIVCMACATGYGLEVPRGAKAVDRARLIKRFRLESTRIDGKIRCKMHTEIEPTDSFVPIDSRSLELDVVIDDIPDLPNQVLGFPVEGIPCPHCSETALKFYFDDPDTCPSCGADALRKSLIWGSFV